MEENNNGRLQQILGSIRRAATRNLWLKLISLLLAFVLWFAITGGPRTETTISVRLDLTRFIPDGWALADNYTDEFEITLRGRDDVIQRLSSSEAAQADVTFALRQDALRAVQEPQFLDLDPQNDIFVRSSEILRSSPGSIEVLQIEPDRILVKLDRRVRENRDVKITLQGDLPDGLQLFTDPPEVRPRNITISGAESRVTSITAVSATLDINGININGPQLYSSRVLLERDPLLQYDDREVVVNLDVVEVSESGRYTINNVLFSGVDEATERVDSYRPEQFNVEVTGPASWIQQLDAENVSLNVDLSLIERNANVTINLLPDMVTFANPHPRSEELVSVSFSARTPRITVRINSQ